MTTTSMGGGCSLNRSKPGTYTVEFGCRWYEVYLWKTHGCFDIIATCTERWIADAIVREARKRKKR